MIALVPTCNRPELFARLVSKLEGFSVIGFVNNSTPENMARYKALHLPVNTELIFTRIKGEPKTCHVHVFRLMLQHAHTECLIIEDDVYPCADFYCELQKRIGCLKALHANFVLSPIYIPTRNSDFYTGAISRLVQIGDYQFIDAAWIDGNFYMTAEILAAMKLWLARRVKIYPASSGIGRKNSREIARHQWKMYTTVPTLVEHNTHHSVMFGNRRTEIPLIAKR